MKSRQILNTLPRIVEVDDYHTLNYLADDVSKFLGLKISVKELGFSKGSYIGIVYQDRLPAQNIIRAMLRHHKIVLED